MTSLNKLDVESYHKFTDYLDGGQYNNFPTWHPDCLDLYKHKVTAVKEAVRKLKARKNTIVTNNDE